MGNKNIIQNRLRLLSRAHQNQRIRLLTFYQPRFIILILKRRYLKFFVADKTNFILDKVYKMVTISTKALKQHNSNLAKTLAPLETEVDKLYNAYLEELMKSTSIDKWDMCDLLVVRYLERIADHTTYVGESIVYIDEGKKISLR